MSLFTTIYFESSKESLDKQSRKLIFSTIQMLENNPKSDSLKLHRITKVKCDSRFWSARVNSDLRIIFVQLGDDKKLLYVAHHEEAYNWCEGKYYGKTEFGAEIIIDNKLEMQVVENFESDNEIFSVGEVPLLSKNGIKTKDLKKLGISELHANNLLSITDDYTFLEYVDIFPEEISEALCLLADGKPFDQVYNSLIDEDYISGSASEQKDTQRRFHMLQSLDELETLLNSDDFEAWTLFLHPNQEKLVRMNSNGPVLIEGGPGTGKTVVGIHRASYLSRNIFTPEAGKRVLICTYSRKLAKSIEKKLDLLMGQTSPFRKNIDVKTVDAYILYLYNRIYKKSASVSYDEILPLLNRCYEEIKPTGSLDFYRYEYEEIIERNNIKTLTEYLSADRSGGKVPLNEKQRKTAWLFFSAFLEEKQRLKLHSISEVAFDVYNALPTHLDARAYDSIIIDEAQDLEPIKLRLLAASAEAECNNVMILSDVNQRIFRMSSWKKDANISITGRTYYLSLNYRTTKQISDYARAQFVNSDITPDHIREYQSVVNGLPPIVEGFDTESAQRKYIADMLTKKCYCPPDQICIICATSADCGSIKTTLEDRGITCTVLDGDKLPSVDGGVNICTINGVKGLEFRIVFLYNYSHIGVTTSGRSQNDIIRTTYLKLVECQKYVASTRARDELIITYLKG